MKSTIMPLGKIDYGDHVPPDLLDFCSEGVLKMDALSRYKEHLDTCGPCKRNFEVYFGPGKTMLIPTKRKA